MLNKVVLQGRIANDLETKVISSGTSVLSFTIAVERNYSKSNADRETDFIDCVAWGKRSEFISAHFSKGDPILIEGEMRTRKWQDPNGQNRKAVEVLVIDTQFCGSKRKAEVQPASNTVNGTAPFLNPSNESNVSINDIDEFVNEDDLFGEPPF